MSAVLSTTRPVSRWRLRLHYTGAALIGIIGLTHMVVKHVVNGPLPAREQAIADLSAATPSPLFEGGLQLTVLDYNTGCSVEMALLGTMFAILAILAARSAPASVGRWSLFGFACFVTSTATCWIAALYFPEPVVAVAGLSAVCFAAAFAAPDRATAAAR